MLLVCSGALAAGAPAPKKASAAFGEDTKEAPAPAADPVSRVPQPVSRIPTRTPHLAIEQLHGSPVLVVHFAWKPYWEPSVEIRRIEEKQADDATIRPISFVERFFKGKTKAAVFEARDRAWDLPWSVSITEQKRDLEILGFRNQMAQPASVVVLPGLAAKDEKKPAEELAPRAVFCLLESWAADDHTLRLEPPAPYFKEPAPLRVWFLREGDVLWSETIAWPGIKANPVAR